MPSPTYKQNKKSIYRWKELNPNRVRQIDLKYKKKRYQWIKIQFEFFNILLIN